VHPSPVWLNLRRERGHGSLRAIVRQSLEGLTVLHARNITHRDLKPPNLIIRVPAVTSSTPAYGSTPAPAPGARAASISAGTPEVRLADFGSAVDPETTRPRVGMYAEGTPSVAEETEGYQPPEAALGGEAYAERRPEAYDLWSMGIVVLEALLGTPHVLPLSRRAEAVLRLRYAQQPQSVMRRLVIANALAEHCILPAAAAAAPAAVARYGRKGAACGKAEFVARVLASDPLRSMAGLSLDESPRLLELVDLAWHLLRWQPEDRMSAARALRHPALLEIGSEIVSL